MMKLFRSTVLVALIVSWCITGAAYAQLPPGPICPRENGEIAAYFDVDGTQRYMDAGPVGNLVPVWIYGQARGNVLFVSGAEFQVDYGPNLTWIADIPLYGAYIGNTRDGYSVGFGMNPQSDHFRIVDAICVWNGDCSAGHNEDWPVVRGHPLTPNYCPVFATFPHHELVPVFGARSQLCQLVELDIKPGSCPNPFNVNLFDWLAGATLKTGGVLPVAILGSETVDVADIDPASIFLEGVAPLRYEYEDVATLDGHDDCECNDGDADGYMDLTLKFSKMDIALALLMEDPYHVGQVLPLTLGGAYMDGMPFSASDCITLVGNDKSKKRAGMDGASALGFPTPNPFNPVTRISYSVPTTQHVRIAIYDVAGRLVEDLVNETRAAGEHVVEWDAGRLPSGVYFYRMQTGDRTIVRRATLLK